MNRGYWIKKESNKIVVMWHNIDEISYEFDSPRTKEVALENAKLFIDMMECVELWTE